MTEGSLRHRGCRRGGFGLLCRHGDADRRYLPYYSAAYVDELVKAARRLLLTTSFDPMKADPRQSVAIIALEQVLDQYEGPP